MTILQNYPNPFNPTTKFTYTINSPGVVSLKIYNVMGELVRTIFQEYKEEGTFEAHWNGRDDNHQTISSGTETKVAFNTEVFDSDNAFDNSSNYRFTVPSGKAGKYFFTAKNRVIGDSAQGRTILVQFYKNGSVVNTSSYDFS